MARAKAAGELREERRARRKGLRRIQTGLTRKLSKEGKIRLRNDLTLLRARKLFVIDLLPLRAIAKELNCDLSTLQRWSHLHNWEDDRSERERYLYQRVSGIRRNLVPDIDAKHDKIFASLEQLLEQTVADLTNEGVAVPAHHLRTLANTAKICQDARRVVHKKENAGTRNVLEIQQSPELYERFVSSLVTLTKNEAPPKLLDVQDAEFEVIDDSDSDD